MKQLTTNDKLIKVSMFSAKYKDEASAKVDYYAVKECYENNNVLEDLNAAVVFKNSSNKIEIIVKNEYSTRQQSWIGMLIGFGLAVILIAIVIPAFYSPIEANEHHYIPLKVVLLTLLGALIGGLIGHIQSGIGRSHLKDLSDVLDTDEYGLLVVSFGDMSQKVKDLIPVDNKIFQHEFETTKKKLIQKIKKELRG